jgi:pimeloyl-ACP methyl ester carboxylesterase
MSRTGKAGSETWTLDLLAEDGTQVTQFLCQRLRQQKVILVGHSQGTAIALLMMKRRPDLFHAYVGTGQIVDMLRNEAISYKTAVERARTINDAKALKALLGVGAPPYPQVKTWLVKQRWGMNATSEMAAWQPLAARMVLSAPCYSLRDVYYAFTGVLFMSQPFYNEYMGFDARRLEIFETPFFIFQGESDVLTPTALAQEYFAAVAAPTKGLVLLKGGGHMALLTLPEQFLQELLTRVRPLTLPKMGVDSPSSAPAVRERKDQCS